MVKPKIVRKQDFCPKCFLESNGKESILNYRPGASMFFTCECGHEFNDREELAALMNQAKLAREAKEPPVLKESEPVKQDTPDQTVVSPPDDKTGLSEVAEQAGGVTIGPVDFSRISSIVGHFTDSSSLFGAIFALQQELESTRVELHQIKEARNFTAAGPEGGDVLVQVVVPEAHVIPMTDVAEANGMDLASFMSCRVKDALEAMWWY